MPEPCPSVTEAEFTALPVILQETWEAGHLRNVEFTEGGLRLKGQPEYREDRRFTSAGWTEVVAMAIDRCDQIYILDQNGHLWVYDPVQQTGETLPCQLPLGAPSGLAVSDLNIFLSEAHRVLALSRGNGQIRWIWEEAGAAPGDLAVHSGQLYVLDRAGRRVLVLGPGGTRLGYFGEEVLTAPSRMALGGDGVLYVLDGSKIVRFNRQGTHLTPDMDINPPRLPAAVAVASLAADAAGILYIGDSAALTGTEETRVIHRLLPGDSGFQSLLGYTGPAFQMAFDRHGNLILVVDGGTLVRLKRVILYPSSGSFLLKPLDSGTPHTRWHKFLLEGERSQETSIVIKYLVRDGKKALTLNELKALPDVEWSAPLVNFTDARVESATGRFLALRGELTTNNPLTTPSVRVLTAVFPSRSYLRYLPPIYQDDPGGKAFLERFLAIFETLTGRLDAGIDDTQSLIDPAATPVELLPWLSSWLALGLEEGWTESQRRDFLAQAMTLYKQRGTREGISRSMKLIIGKAPMIVEPFQLDCIENPSLREQYEPLYGTGDCHFCVLLEPEVANKPETMAMIGRMVAEQVPAHVRAGVLGLRPWFHLGLHTYLGINTHLTRPAIRLEESVLGGGETGLVESDEAGQVERKARIGVDTTLT